MIKGSLPALVTPFKNGKLDLDTLKKLVEWHVGQGSHGLVPVGTTGESPTLSHEEHDLVVETVIKVAAGRIPVVAGAGSNNTIETVRLVEAAKKAGADAALVVTPYYNKPTQRGLIAHFEIGRVAGFVEGGGDVGGFRPAQHVDDRPHETSHWFVDRVSCQFET